MKHHLPVNLIQYIFAALIIAGCTTGSIVKDAHVRYEMPVQTLPINPDTTFRENFMHCIYPVDMAIVCDTVLLIRDNISNVDYKGMYKSYSLNDFAFLGEFINIGRGPGELLSPKIYGEYGKSDESLCYVFDIQLHRSFEFDLQQSMITGVNAIRPKTELPAGTLFALPYHDSLQFIGILSSNKILYQIMDDSGEVLQTFDIYDNDIYADRNFPQLSCCPLINQDKGLSAMLMLGLPQINIIDLDTGETNVMAVDKDYRKWKKLINSYNMKSILYYNTAWADSEHIFAVYENRTIEDTINNPAGAHIHMFDWNGTFLYDLVVQETVRTVVFDKARGFLYGLDKTGKIYRYDLPLFI